MLESVRNISNHKFSDKNLDLNYAVDDTLCLDLTSKNNSHSIFISEDDAKALVNYFSQARAATKKNCRKAPTNNCKYSTVSEVLKNALEC